MKLYATTTSERASKGQGGNEYLEIVVTGEDKKPFLEMKITPKGDHYDISGYVMQAEHAPNRRSEQFFKYEVLTKGEQKKGELTETCGHPRNSAQCSDCIPY